MSMLERAVADLADALDSLETKIAEKTAANEADTPALRRHLRSANDCTQTASRELSAAIDDLKSVLDKGKG